MQNSEAHNVQREIAGNELGLAAAAAAIAPPRAHETVAYRPDIDGLRALAVLPVLFFHAHLAGFSGGYVGVDVFFVISGYLITSIIWRDLQLDRFSIVQFYERRVRRLLPALFAVLIVTSALAAWLLLPLKFRDFGKSMIAVGMFATNILFFRDTGYFDSPAELKPLLHTWSLGVEEQFYVFFPLILLLLNRWRQGLAPVLCIVALAIVSFAANVALTPTHQSATFYLLPFRAWELMLGAFLAVAALRAPRNVVLTSSLGLLGIGLIVFSVIVYTNETPFPGWAAALPCIGSTLIIYSGEARQGAAYRILSQPVLTFVGKISYSLYLWHWPIVVFAKLFTDDGKIRPMTTLVIVTLSFIAATLSLWYVETPFRDSKRFSRKTMFLAAAAATALWFAIGGAAYVTNGMPSRLSDDVRPFAAAAEDFLPGPPVCRKVSDSFGENMCYIGASDRKPTILLWGDSHAGMAVHGVEAALAKHGVAAFYAGMGGCPPLLGVEKDEIVSDAATDAKCARHNTAVFDLLKQSPDVRTVLLVSRWAYFASGEGFGSETNRVRIWNVGTAEPATSQDNATIFTQGLSRTLQELRALDKRVFVLEQVPELDGYSAEQIANKIARRGEAALADSQSLLTVSRERVETRQRAFTDAIAAANDPNVTVLRTRDFFCDAQTCRALLDGAPAYFDNNHVTIHTSRGLQSIYEPLFAP